MMHRKLLTAMVVVCLLGGCKHKNEANTDLIPVKTNDNGWIFIDQKGEVVIKPTQHIHGATFFYEGYSRVSIANETSQTLSRPLTFMNTKGELISGKKYKDATIFNDGIAWVVEENGYPTAINSKGEALFALKTCEKAGIFTEGLAPACFTEDAIQIWGYVDKKGKTVISPTFAMCSGFKSGLAPAVKDEAVGWGYINKKGEFAIQPQFSVANCFCDNGLAIVGIGDRNRKFGIIDRKGKYVVSPQYDVIIADGDNYIVRTSDVYGWIDKDGKILINPQFKQLAPFGDSDVTGVSIDGEKYGLIDRKGKYILNPQYEGIVSYIGNVAPFLMSGKTGFIDSKGKIVINPQYTDIPRDHMYNLMRSVAYDCMDAEDLYAVKSDYFDIEAVTSNLLKDSGPGSFRGISGNTTFGQVKNSYDGLSYYTSRSRKSNETINLSNGVSISQIVFSFPEELSKSSYNYYDNTYETEENTELAIRSVEYRLELDYRSKASDKASNIMRGIADAIVKKYDVSGDRASLASTDSGITIHTSSIEFSIKKYSSALWIDVTFNN